ncbi:MAG: SpoIVB peptidase [Firmicutes bacterium]|nr:SpoIVB peptidase [Bacillota bacterium]
MGKIKKGWMALVLSLLFLSVPFLFFGSAQHYFVAAGDTLGLPKIFSAFVEYGLSDERGVIAEENGENYRFLSSGEYALDSKLFGLVPLQDVSVSVYDEKEVVPGGHSVGLIMKTRGVVVVGYSAVTDDRGKTVYPAKDCGVSLGDCVVKIEGNEVHSDDDVMELIDRCGEDGKVELELSRGGETRLLTVDAYPCPETERNRIGLYVRDNTGGVGTMTFYDPATGRYGALGHTVPEAEEDENGISGRILPSSISGINAAGEGKTGEKIGYFDPGEFEGTIDHISIYGVFGTLEEPLQNEELPLVQTASPDEVEKGAAQIITVLDGNTPEWFDIEITDIDFKDDTGKGLSITITDKKLLQRTGGIIQGMSGSPIIQNGKLVGAVTYVMVNQPERGYGVLIDYMLNEAG